MGKVKPENAKRVLVVKLRHIGDVLMMTPMLRALKDAMPEAEITAVVPGGMEDLLANNPCSPTSEMMLFKAFAAPPSIMDSLLTSTMGHRRLTGNLLL